MPSRITQPLVFAVLSRAVESWTRWGRCPDMLPVVSRKVVESEHLLFVLRRHSIAFGCVALKRFPCCREKHKLVHVLQLARYHAGCSLPLAVWTSVTYSIQLRSCEPSKVGAGSLPNFFDSLPEPWCTITNGQCRSVYQSLLLNTAQQFLPTLGGLPIPVFNGNQLFFAMVSHSDQHQRALATFGTSDVEVNSISPDVNIVLVFQITLAPLLILFNPASF